MTLSTKNILFICEKIPLSRVGFVESRLAALEMQMKEVMSHTSPSSFSVTTPHPRTYSAYVDNGIQNKQRQLHHVPHHAQTVSLPASFNNKPAYNTHFALPSLTQTKHSAPHHGQLSKIIKILNMHGIQLRDLSLGLVGQRLYTTRSNPLDSELQLGVMTVWFLT